ncbi:MAG: ParB/RepB/Spo0J family partition protein [Lachnospiraceae bacterium]|nr:ParB/RepB/Spo0J family partition protein [Lachnospiraceae bacterium]
MAAKNKRGLGRGLDGMIPAKNPVVAAAAPAAGSADGSPLMLDIKKIKEDKSQPRKNFNEDRLQELADSITEHGIVEPLIVTEEGAGYMLVAGERRLRAAKLAGLKEVPVIVRSFENEQERRAAQIIENLQREDLNPIEEAEGFLMLKEKFSMTDDEVARVVSKSRAAVTNSMRLLKLDKRVQQMVIDEQLSMGHARALLAIEDGEKQFLTGQDAFDQKLSVRELEKLVKKLISPAKSSKKKKEDLSQYQIHFDEYAERLAQRLGVKVKAKLKDKSSGQLEIDFYSIEDFDRFYDKLSRE